MEGSRICFKDSYGTIRWTGSIEGKEGNWLGIEWDDPEKGKHSGSFEGVQYFFTKFPGCGSFLKENIFTEGNVEGCSLHFAIFDKYADKNVQDFSDCYANTVQNNKKQIEMIGTEKIQKKQEQITNLKEIALQSTLISKVEEGFGASMLSCEILLLDKNLLNSWDQVSIILKELPQLHTLSLASNRIEGSLGDPVSHGLSILVLNNMALQWVNILPILQQFPFLKELNLYKNLCNDFIIPPDLLSSVKLLNLEDNKITSWEAISNQFKSLANLEKLIINGNPIGNIVYFGGFEKLTALSVENCGLNDWRSIEEIGKFQAGIREVRIAKNEGLVAGLRLSIFRFNAIARIGALNILSGSAVRPQERIEAERYYLRSYTEFPEIVNSYRWNELVQKHGPPADISCDLVSEQDMLARQTLNSNTITVMIRSLARVSAGKELSKKLYLNMSVGDLKIMCGKLFGLQNNAMKISFRSKENIMPEFLEDNLKTIGYYIINESGELWVEDL